MIKMNCVRTTVTLGFVLVLTACSQEKMLQRVNKEVAVIETNMGSITLNFYDEDAPKHVANFKKLAREGFYDGTTFHRVIEGFMIQGGDPLSKDGIPENDGTGNPGYTIPAEIKRFHKRGALAAARTPDHVNPQKASSGSQFYIVQAPSMSLPQLKTLEARLKQSQGKTLTQEQIDLYTTVGGTPFLDGDYTVYGEVVSGMEVVDQIARVPRDGRDRPLENVVIKKITLSLMEVMEYR